MTQMRAMKPTITNSALRASASTVSASPLPRSHVRRPVEPRAALPAGGEALLPLSEPDPARPGSRPVAPAPRVGPGLLLIITPVRLSLLAELAPPLYLLLACAAPLSPPRSLLRG